MDELEAIDEERDDAEMRDEAADAMATEFVEEKEDEEDVCRAWGGKGLVGVLATEGRWGG